MLPLPTAQKRALDESDLPWRVRRPLCEVPQCEPRLEPPRSQQRRAAGVALLRRKDDPLEAIGLRAKNSKEQIDALEKMLFSKMPSRVTLENAFTGLRSSVAEEMQVAMEVQWKRGVKHAQAISEARIAELEKQIADDREFDAILAGHLADDEAPEAEDADLISELTRFLYETQDENVPQNENMPQAESPRSVIDLNALSREIHTISNLVTIDA